MNMNNDHKQIILNAISDGFLKIPASRDSILILKHRLECIERNMPIIQLLFFGDYAVLAADIGPLRYPDSLKALLWEFDVKFFRMSEGKPLIIAPADQGKALARRLSGIGIQQIDLEEHRRLVDGGEENILKSPFQRSIGRG